MKCRYNNCKHGGEVSKEQAIKEGSMYFHKDCLEEKKIKQQIEEYYVANMPPTTLMLLRKVIKQAIHEKGISAEYLLYVIKYIHKNNKPINNPFGLISYCNEGRLRDGFKKELINKKYKEMKSNINNENNNYEKVEFTYKPTNKRFTDIV